MGEPGAHEFTVVASHTVYRGAILALRTDEVAMPGGSTGTREVVEHHGAVAILAVDEDDQVIMIHQYRHPVGRRLWELPAGLLDIVDEEPAAAAARELVEEAGVSATHWSVLVDVAPSPGSSDEAVRVFLAQGLSAVGRPDGEHEEADLVVRRVAFQDAVARVLAGDIVNAPTVAGLLALAASRASATAPRAVTAPWRDRPHAFDARAAEAR